MQLALGLLAHTVRASVMDSNMRNEASSIRKAANLSIKADLLAEAKSPSVNISRAAEAGVAEVGHGCT